MNERIRELAKESDLDWHKHWNDDESNRLEKFAELIVRECIDVISPYAVRMENFDGEHPITDLKKHFGVEEC